MGDRSGVYDVPELDDLNIDDLYTEDLNTEHSMYSFVVKVKNYFGSFIRNRNEEVYGNVGATNDDVNPQEMNEGTNQNVRTVTNQHSRSRVNEE
jgi:hypothetical protein